ncbi:hypothetical protein FACS189485_22030 [Spirochaetia bacterium]|nr:hypothetical protein FACS189485_22030 [Spirochaetia bacterium]
MKTYFCVMSEYYDNGTVKAAIIREKLAKKKPASTSVSNRFADCYTEWFDTYEGAQAAVKEARAA